MKLEGCYKRAKQVAVEFAALGRFASLLAPHPPRLKLLIHSHLQKLLVRYLRQQLHVALAAGDVVGHTNSVEGTILVCLVRPGVDAAEAVRGFVLDEVAALDGLCQGLVELLLVGLGAYFVLLVLPRRRAKGVAKEGVFMTLERC